MKKVRYLFLFLILFFGLSIFHASGLLRKTKFGVEKDQFKEISLWFIQNGISEYYQGKKIKEIRGEINFSYFRDAEIKINKNDYIAVLSLLGRSGAYYAAYCFKREKINDNIYEFWAIQYFGNERLYKKPKCEFWVAKTDKLEGKREIIHKTKKYFEYYKTKSGENIYFPDDNKTLYRLGIWLFPDSYKKSKYKKAKIIYTEDRKYKRTSVVKIYKKNYEWIWQQGTSGNEEWCKIILDEKGNSISFLEEYTSGHSPRATKFVKYDFNHKKIWEHFLGRCYEYREGVSSIFWDRETGDYYFSKGVPIPGKSIDYYIIKTRADFSEVWKKEISTPKSDSCYVSAIDPKGFLYVTGVTSGILVKAYKNKGNDDIYLMKIDSRNGDILWTKQFGSSELDICDVVCDNEGNIYLIASMGDFEDFKIYPGKYNENDIYLMKFDSDGNRKWIKKTGTNYCDGVKYVKMGHSGYIYIYYVKFINILLLVLMNRLC